MRINPTPANFKGLLITNNFAINTDEISSFDNKSYDKTQVYMKNGQSYTIEQSSKVVIPAYLEARKTPSRTIHMNDVADAYREQQDAYFMQRLEDRKHGVSTETPDFQPDFSNLKNVYK